MKVLTLVLTVLFGLMWIGETQAAQRHGLDNGLNSTQKDQRLAGKIRSSIAFERKLSGQNIRVTVHNCVVSVRGEVHSQQHHQLVLAIITQTAGDEVQLTAQNLKLASL